MMPVRGGGGDASRQPVPGTTRADLADDARDALRRAIERYRGEASLLAMSNEAMDDALGLVDGDQATFTGILLLGTDDALQQHAPGLGLQVVSPGQQHQWVCPIPCLMDLCEAWLSGLQKHFGAQDIRDGLFRLSIPRIEPRVFREAMFNALTHRDYTSTEYGELTVGGHTLEIQNPGGFQYSQSPKLPPQGSHPGNAHLCAVMKRLGMGEPSGLGIDFLASRMTRFGRPAPDFSGSTPEAVVVRLPLIEADVPFLRMILREEGKRRHSLDAASLALLYTLRQAGTAVSESGLLASIPAYLTGTPASLESLCRSGLVSVQLGPRGPMYALVPALDPAPVVVPPTSTEDAAEANAPADAILRHLESHDNVTRSDIMELCGMTGPQATKLLGQLVDDGKLKKVGKGRGTHYVAIVG